MSEGYVTNLIRNTEKTITDLFDSAISEYEKLLRFTDNHSASAIMRALTKHSQQDKAWISNVYTETVRSDMYISGASSFLSLIGVKNFNLETYNYLNFTPKDLMRLFEALQTLATAPTIEDESIYLLAEQADKLLSKDTIEYRVIRLICVCKVLELYTICNVLAKFILSQDTIQKGTKISISPNIHE